MRKSFLSQLLFLTCLLVVRLCSPLALSVVEGLAAPGVAIAAAGGDRLMEIKKK